jgi:hypothetical protein
MSANGALGGQWDTSYRGGHAPPAHGAPLHDLEASDQFPAKVYDELHHYTHMSGQTRSDQESVHGVRSARGKPEKSVSVYRAAPAGTTHINPGDWVALSPHYAKEHAAGAGPGPNGGSDWPIHSAKVPAKHVRNGGNDIVEWGYHGEKPMPVTTKHPPKRGWSI